MMGLSHPKGGWEDGVFRNSIGDLGGGNSSIFYFHPYLGKIPILTNIFQRGWKHQLVIYLLVTYEG